MKSRVRVTEGKVLDFDVETVAAGFADPNWVPQRVTCIAWSWVGKKKIEHATRLEGAYFMFSRFLRALYEADMVTGHNLIRFDLPVLNADLIRVGFPSLKPVLVQDTIRIVKTKGFKKGQDNIAQLFGVRAKKLNMDWQAWEDAYQWDDLIAGRTVDWDVVIKRCRGDVRQHKQMRKAMLRENLVKAPTMWRP